MQKQRERHGRFRAILIASVLSMVLGQPALTVGQSVSHAPATLDTSGVYVENFSTYSSKDYVENATWDIWLHSLRLARPDAADRSGTVIVTQSSGVSYIAWSDGRRGDSDVFLQKLGVDGNRLWPNDVRVNTDNVTSAFRSIGHVGVDVLDNINILWHDYRNGHDDIYAERLDPNGNRLYSSDLLVYSGNDSRSSTVIDVSPIGEAIIVWCDSQLTGEPHIYAQRYASNGARQWPDAVRVDQVAGATNQSLPDVRFDDQGYAIITWAVSFPTGEYIYSQRLDAAGLRVWSSDVVVNTRSRVLLYPYTGYNVTVDHAGKVSVVWDNERDGNRDIYMQRIDLDGNRMWASDLRVNQATTGTQYAPSIAVDPQGYTVLAWMDDHNGVGSPNLFFQRINSSGLPQWPGDIELPVLGYATGAGTPESPAIVLDDSGNAVFSWRQWLNSGSNILADRISVNGWVQWSRHAVVNDAGGTASQASGSVTLDGAGNTYVLWYDDRNQIGISDGYLQQITSAGTRNWRNDIQVAKYGDSPTDIAKHGDITTDYYGNTVAAWYEKLDTGDEVVYAQRLDAFGNKLWSTDIVVTKTTGSINSVRIALDPNGDAVVAWDHNLNSIANLYAQRIHSDGSKAWPAAVRINTPLSTYYKSFDLDVDTAGNAIIVWDDTRNGYWDVYAQRLNPTGGKLWSDTQINAIHYSTSWFSPGPRVGTDALGNIIVGWIGYLDQGWPNVYTQKISASGVSQWGQDIKVNDDAVEGDSIDLDVDNSGNVTVVWKRLWTCMSIQAQRLNVNGVKQWPSPVRVSSYNGTVCQASPQLSLGLDGTASVLWTDNRNGNSDVYMQRINSVGNRIWPEDLQVVTLDVFYMPSGTAQSRSVDTTLDNIAQAKLTTNIQLNGGGARFYLTNNGADWVETTPGVVTVFTTTGSDLRWRVDMSADPLWPRTPVVTSLRIEYNTQAASEDSYEPDDTCAQAKVMQPNGASQQHTFHQPGDADWVRFDAIANTDYVLVASNLGALARPSFSVRVGCNTQIATTPPSFGPEVVLPMPASSYPPGAYYVRITNTPTSTYGAEVSYTLSLRADSAVPAAIIIAGKNGGSIFQNVITQTTDFAYNVLLRNGFTKDRIYYIDAQTSRDADGNGLSDDIDATATVTNVQYAIQVWAREHVGLGKPLWLFMADHGLPGVFQVSGDGANDVLTPALLNLWLSNLEATSGVDRINVIIDACHSGSFITAAPGISGFRRVIVASTSADRLAFGRPEGPGIIQRMYFSEALWGDLDANLSLGQAYENAKEYVLSAMGGQQLPWLDDNGDGVPDTAGDGTVARGYGLSGALAFSSRPYIHWQAATATGNLSVLAQDDAGVNRVIVEVMRPGLLQSNPDGQIVLAPVERVAMSSQGNGLWAGSYNGFTATGVYHLVAYAWDRNGTPARPDSISMSVALTHRLYAPFVLR